MLEPSPLLQVEPDPVPSGARFKLSRYNVGKGALLFNTLTGALVDLTSRQEYELGHVRATGQPADLSECESLRRLGFVADAEVDELAAVWGGFLLSQGSAKPAVLTIAPILDCNFGCEYCFETHRPGVMSPTVRDQLIQFLRARHAASPVSLHVVWFGGEPLMAQGVIFDLASKFDELVAEGVLRSWGSELITNGLLLCDGLVGRLRQEARVSRIQITIDGDQEHHDARRFLKRNRTGTFVRVVENAVQAAKVVPVGIRVNVDRTNQDCLETMMRQFADAGMFQSGSISINLALVEPFTEADVIRNATTLLSAQEFATLREEFLCRAQREGWPAHEAAASSVVSGVCQVDNKNAFVVAPDGALMKCWAELGNDPEVVGHLGKRETWQEDMLGTLEDRDPLDDKGCRTCKLLPMCMGGCPQQRALWRKKGVKHCPPLKYAFGGYLDKLAKEGRATDNSRCGDCHAD